MKAEAAGEKRRRRRRPKQPIEDLLADARRPSTARRSPSNASICHNVQEGQGAKVGPDLYGVVGPAVASVAGFNYSAAALKTKGGTWTFDALNKWLTEPSADAPGTAMTFAGLANEKQRADLIAYLDTLSTHPVPLPTAQGAAAPAAKPAPPRHPAGALRLQPPPQRQPGPCRSRLALRPTADVKCHVVAVARGAVYFAAAHPARWRRNRKGTIMPGTGGDSDLYWSIR